MLCTGNSIDNRTKKRVLNMTHYIQSEYLSSTERVKREKNVKDKSKNNTQHSNN
jgi:hypothetical protein